VIAAYKTTPGNRGAHLISRPDGDRTEFLTISFWDDLKSIEAFARPVHHPLRHACCRVLSLVAENRVSG
jgi:heme-degrading monooxygenase HmoA